MIQWKEKFDFCSEKDVNCIKSLDRFSPMFYHFLLSNYTPIKSYYKNFLLFFLILSCSNMKVNYMAYLLWCPRCQLVASVPLCREKWAKTAPPNPVHFWSGPLVAKAKVAFLENLNKYHSYFHCVLFQRLSAIKHVTINSFH